MISFINQVIIETCLLVNLLLKFLAETIKLWIRNLFIPSKYLYKNVSGEIAMVTGAAGGIGHLIASNLLKLGCKVVLIDRNEQELNKISKLLKNHYPESSIYSFKLDLTSLEEIKRVSDAIKSKIGDVTIIFNNAGVNNGKLLIDLSENEIRNLFNVNILAQFFICKQFLPKMIELNRGHIINISSACGIMGAYKLTDYCASKFAVNGFTESLRVELQTLNPNNKIKTSMVCPFHVQTKLFNGVQFKYLKWLGLSMTPEYVANYIIDGMLLNKDIIYIPRLIVILQTLFKATQISGFYDYANIKLSENVPNLTLRDTIKPICWLTYTFGVCIALPLLVIERNKTQTAPMDAWFIGGVFVLATLPLSMYSIIGHSLNYVKPHLQKYIIRILFMVPIYALNSWIVLRFPTTSIYLDTFRECYEAFVIYNFMIYLCNFLNYEVDDFSESFTEKRNINLIFPLCLFPSCSNGFSLLNRCKFGVLQYTLIRVLTTIIAFICELCLVYKEGDINFKFAWPYLVIMNNFSQMIAMYCLVLFYTLCRKELSPLNPVSQFLCIKFVVFATFWQGVLIAILVRVGIITTDRWPYFHTVTDCANGLQDFAICIEMFIAAVAHLFAFSHKPYKREMISNERWWRNLLQAANVSDVHSDVIGHVRQIGSKVKSLSSSRSSIYLSESDTPNERSRLITTSSKRESIVITDTDEITNSKAESASQILEKVIVQSTNGNQDESSMNNFYASTSLLNIQNDSRIQNC